MLSWAPQFPCGKARLRKARRMSNARGAMMSVGPVVPIVKLQFRLFVLDMGRGQPIWRVLRVFCLPCDFQHSLSQCGWERQC